MAGRDDPGETADRRRMRRRALGGRRHVLGAAEGGWRPRGRQTLTVIAAVRKAATRPNAKVRHEGGSQDRM